MGIAKYNELLDFSQWTVSEYNSVRLLHGLEIEDMEQKLMNDDDDMSQIDHVNLVLTYKMRIAKLESDKVVAESLLSYSQ